MIALYVMGCLHGTLHGAPHDVCREIPIRSYDNDEHGNGIVSCTQDAQAGAVSDWIKRMKGVGIDVYIPSLGGWRCAPRRPGDRDD
jgi:hypothetical protein